MKKRISPSHLLAVLFLLLVSTNVAFGFPVVKDPYSSGERPTVPANFGIPNPLGITDLTILIQRIIDAVLTIGIPIIALMIMYTGFKYVQARGNAGEIGKVHTMLQYTLIGTALVLSAAAILELLQGTLTQIFSS